MIDYPTSLEFTEALACEVNEEFSTVITCTDENQRIVLQGHNDDYLANDEENITITITGIRNP